MITLYDKGAHIPLLWTHLIPATLEGRALHNVQNALFAAAMAYSVGKSLEDIRHGLRTFDSSYFQAPGRMNVFNEHPFKVILDYAHNPAAIEAMTRLAQQLDPAGRRICVATLPGDRRDEDLAQVAQILAGNFDHYVCRRDDNLRGRGPEEMPTKLRTHLMENGVAESAISVIPEEEKAVEAALKMAEPEDLLLIFGDDVARCWKQIIYFNREDRPGDGEADGAVTREAEPPAPLTDPKPVPDAPPAPELPEMSQGALIRDERGVRLAREPEESD
jgi:cyanophycin synthetase